MGRKKSVSPGLFQRTSNGSYYFRRVVGNGRESINTHTSNHAEAQEFLRNYLRGEGAIELAVQQSQNTYKIANTLAKAVTGQSLERMPLNQVMNFWEEHNPHFMRTGERYIKLMRSNFRRFENWCAAQNIEFIESVDNSAALRYHVHLYTEQYAPRTIKKQIQFLAKVFRCVDALKHLPNRNPFSPDIVKPSNGPRGSEATHLPLEPEMLEAVMKAAAEAGEIWLDLFVVAMQTGMRLKDAALFRWDMVKHEFIEFTPEKTMHHGNQARLPVSPLLASLLARRKKNNFSIYVNPEIADLYQRGDWVVKRAKEIFELALGKANTQLDKAGRQRKRNGCIRSFHSFRVTFMSLLATKQVPMRDAMTMLGWESIEMVQLYTKMLEQAKGDMDKRNKELIDGMKELNIALPTPVKPFTPTREALAKLLPDYSNVAIGKIYGISDVAIKKWLDKFGLIRAKRIESPELSETEIQKIREELQAA